MTDDGLSAFDVLAARLEADAAADLRTLGLLSRPSSKRPKGLLTWSRESFVHAMVFVGSEAGLALLRVYADFAALDATSDWQVSAAPATAQGRSRLAAITSGVYDLFVVDLYEGYVPGWWSIRLHEDIPPSPLMARRHRGDSRYYLGFSLDQLLEWLADAESAAAILATRDRRAQPRRPERHNAYLGALICPSQPAELQNEETSSLDPKDEVERRYIARTVRQRAHQRAFRDLVMRHHGSACTFCGMDVPGIVEAAHLERVC